MTPPSRKIKVLISGPVLGCFQSFSLKLNSLQSSKAGPFDACFCVGPFFLESRKEEALSLIQEKTRTFPLPVYFVDLGSLPDGIDLGLRNVLQDDSAMNGSQDDAEIDIDNVAKDEKEQKETKEQKIVKIVENLYYLSGPADIVAIPPSDSPSVNTLLVAYAPPHARLGTSTTFPLEQKARNLSYHGCDIFLTSEWPQGIPTALSPNDATKLQSIDLGSYDVAEMTSLIRPRYHFAPSMPSFGYLHFASLPFQNLPSDGDATRQFHVSRFLSMGNVLNAEEAKKWGKQRKFLHAIGIFPLVTMDRQSLMEQPVGTVPHPFTDLAYSSSSCHPMGNSSAASLPGKGISTAVARRLIVEESNGSQHQYRYMRKRPVPLENDQLQHIASMDPSNKCLFLYGLKKDPGNILNGVTLLEAFQPFGCTKIRLPPAQNQKSYGFVEFGSHEDASNCLHTLNGEIVVCGIHLTLKWSSGGRATPRGGETGTDPPPKRTRLTEQQASNSDTLFVRLPKQAQSSDFPEILETIRKQAEHSLEDAINQENPEKRITSEDEPALAVTLRHPTPSNTFGFLSFQSHAAASMAIASLTGSPDGGIVESEQDTLRGIELYWAKGNANADNSSQPKYKETRTDCWFCLASPSCEKHLILTIKELCYVVMPKGPLDPFHSLIVPIKHDDSNAIGSESVGEITSVIQDLRKHTHEVLKKGLFVFERAFETKGGYHPHVQCVPLEECLSKELEVVLKEKASKAGFELKEVNSDLGLKAMMDEDDVSGYFYAEVPIPNAGGEYKRFVYTGESKVPLQFGREVVASVLKKTDVVDWKNCVVDEEKETELANAFRKSFVQE